MNKINFTKEHKEQLQKLAVTALFNGTVFNATLGQQLTVYDLVHNTNINSLLTLKQKYTNEIKKLEETDEWVTDSLNQKVLDNLRDNKQLINLIVGYKRLQAYERAIVTKRLELESKLKELENSQKTPEDQIKEIQEQLASLSTEEF